MITVIFIVLMCTVFGKLTMLAIRAAWGITKILFNLVFLPVFIIGLAVSGFISIAFPILVIVGAVAIFSSLVNSR